MKKMLASPALTAVTRPVPLTLATVGVSLPHVPVSVRPSDAAAVICSVAPRKTFAFGEVTAIETSGGVGAGEVDDPLQPEIASISMTKINRVTHTPLRMSR